MRASNCRNAFPAIWRLSPAGIWPLSISFRLARSHPKLTCSASWPFGLSLQQRNPAERRGGSDPNIKTPAWSHPRAPCTAKCSTEAGRLSRSPEAGKQCVVPCRSLTHAKRNRRSRAADARSRIRFGNCLDLDFAAGTGDGDKLLAGATDEFALGIARGLEECVQACRASRACRPGRTRRALWADAAACTVRAT
jgi:hypothetical protein